MRAVQSFGDPRRQKGQKRQGRDNGEPVVYRKHQIAGDYKTNWTRYQGGQRLLGGAAADPGGGFRVEAEDGDRSDTGYWRQGFIDVLCPYTAEPLEQFGRFFRLNVPSGAYTLEFSWTATVTLWRWSTPPESCAIATSANMELIGAAAAIGGVCTFDLLLQSEAVYSITSGTSGGGYDTEESPRTAGIKFSSIGEPNPLGRRTILFEVKQ